MRPILVTGFAAFGEHPENPSEQVVRALCAGAELVAEVLPVSYRRAEARLRALIEASEPRAMLLLGLYAGEAFRLERVARNRDEAEARDEDGEVRSGRPISACGPAEHASTLPLAAFAEALTVSRCRSSGRATPEASSAITPSTWRATCWRRTGATCLAASCTCRRSRRSRSSDRSRAWRRASRSCALPASPCAAARARGAR